MPANHVDYSSLEQRSVIRYFGGWEVQTMMFTEKCVKYAEKQVFLKTYWEMD